MSQFRNPLHETAETTPTDFWNDSCAEAEMIYAIENGAVGATTNPVIVQTVLSAEADKWNDVITDIIAENPADTEDDIAWKVMEQIVKKRAKLLLPVFEKTSGKKGRIALQVNAKYYRDAGRMTEQAKYFSTLAPNITVKLPCTAAGIEAVERATAAGVSVLATVNFTVAQSIAVAEAVERGLEQLAASGGDTSKVTPVCAVMVGRTDDWLKVVAAKEGIITDPGYLEWPGVAVFKRAYEIFREKGYKTTLMSAAYRNHFHWSEFIGGEVILTIPYGWQRKFNASDVAVRDRMNQPVEPHIIAELEKKFPEFIKAYEPDGLSVRDFDSYGAVARTMRSFTEGYDKLTRMIRDIMMPNPDL